MIEDIPTLQNMVKKRDAIIAEMKEQQTPADIDYEELVIQLKAANGEITRLEEENIQLRKEVEASIGDLEVDQLTTTIADLQKQLDQECDNNAELEDKLDILPIPPYDKEFEERYQKQADKIKLLEEKLKTCDGYYKNLLANTQEVKKFVNDIFT